MANKDREKRETEGWDSRKRITVASVWVAASTGDLIGNDTSPASAEDLVFQTKQCRLGYNGKVVNVLMRGLFAQMGKQISETSVWRNMQP